MIENISILDWNRNLLSVKALIIKHRIWKPGILEADTQLKMFDWDRLSLVYSKLWACLVRLLRPICSLSLCFLFLQFLALYFLPFAFPSLAFDSFLFSSHSFSSLPFPYSILEMLISFIFLCCFFFSFCFVLFWFLYFSRSSLMIKHQSD